MEISIIVFDGADEIDFIAPYTVFGRVATARPDIDVRLVTLTPSVSITGGMGLRVLVDGVLEGLPDLVVVPGGGWVAHAAQGVRAEIERGALPQAIARSRKAGSTIAGICTGAMALAAAGVLSGRVATTHHGAMEDLRAAGVQVKTARVVDTGEVITCGGVTSAFDLSLWMVERLWGAELAGRIARSLEYARSTDVFVRGT